MSTDSKKAVLTDENRAESSKLNQLWQERKRMHNLTQAQFGDRFGIGTQGAVSSFLQGKMAISLKAATGFALGLRCDVAEFSPRLAAQANAVHQAATEAMPPINPSHSVQSAQQNQPVYAIAQKSQWPFEMFSQDEWMLLPKKDREDYESLIYGAVHRAKKTRRRG